MNDNDYKSDQESDLPSRNAELDCSVLTRLGLVTHFLCQQTDLEFSLQQKYLTETSIYFISAKSFVNEKCWIKLFGSNLLREERGPGPLSTSEERSP